MQGQFPFKQWVYRQKWATPCLDRVNRKLDGGGSGRGKCTTSENPSIGEYSRELLLNAIAPKQVLMAELKQALPAICAQFPHHHFPVFCRDHGT